MFEDFPDAGNITEAKRDALIDKIGMLENLLALLIVLRFSDINIKISYCNLLKKFYINKSTSGPKWDYMKRLKVDTETESSNPDKIEEPEDDAISRYLNMQPKDADLRITKEVVDILNTIESAWGRNKNIELTFIYKQLKEIFANKGYCVEVSGKELQISWGANANEKLK